MEAFQCGVCKGLVFFDNSLCLTCGAALGYDPERRVVCSLSWTGDSYAEAGDDVESTRRFVTCANQQVARCNWLIPIEPASVAPALCASCRLTSVRPNDDDAASLPAFADAEAAKRRLLYQIDLLGLPIVDRDTDPDHGLAFEFLSSRGRSVTTGHQEGVVTLDLSESDDAHREFVRQQLGEPYRTVLGHLRHEIGHYFWPRLVPAGPVLDEFRSLFGDERASYADALDQHYQGGGADDWATTHVSQYATMHPWEDWAETFAHYLHIHGGLETASSFGLSVGEPSLSAGRSSWSAPSAVAIGDIVGRWLSLTFALNAMSRSIGQDDLYPFVLSPTVVTKLDFVHRVVGGASRTSGGQQV